MLAIALPNGFIDRNNLVARGPRSRRLATLVVVRLLGLGRSVRCGIAELAQFGLKRSLNVLGIRCRKLVLERERPVRPGGKSLGLT
jgi:hypothetical protein